MKKTLAFLSTILLLADNAYTQQKFHAPQLLNPAMTGFTPSDVRASADFTPTFANATYPSSGVRAAFAADAPLLKARLPMGNALGGGVFGSYQEASYYDTIKLSATNIGLSVAYHMALGDKKDQYLSFAIQGMAGSVSDNGESVVSTTSYHISTMYTRPVFHTATFYAAYGLSGTSLTSAQLHRMSLGSVWAVNNRFTLNATFMPSVVFDNGENFFGYSAIVMGGYMLKPDNKKTVTLYLGATGNGNGLLPYLGVERAQFRLALTPYVDLFHLGTQSGVSTFQVSLLWLGRIKKNSAKLKDAKSFPRIY